MTARQTQSAPYVVGYGKPPRHTQFRKGRSGNPGGRPRREPIERLKALTLQEAYRGVVISRENGVAMPGYAIQAVLRSQIELAMNGNVRAQRDILTAVRTFERADAEAAAMEEYVERLVQEAADLEEKILAARRAGPAAEEEIDYAAAARKIKELLGLNRPRPAAESEVAESETCAPAEETATEESDAERHAAAPQPENDAAPATRPVAPPPPPADAPAARPAEPRPWRSLPDRHARRRTLKSTPSAGADSQAGRLHNRRLRNRCVHRRREPSSQPFNVKWSDATWKDVTWKDVPRKTITSRYSRRQKSGNSLLNSLFSGNADEA